VIETALDHESGSQLGIFGKITLDKKSHATVPVTNMALKILVEKVIKCHHQRLTTTWHAINYYSMWVHPIDFLHSIVYMQYCT
jgi:hypothetical protein